MENTTNRTPNRAPNRTRRRRKRDPMQVFLRVYLPPIIVVVLIILFIIFAVGSVRRGNEQREKERLESLAVESSIAQQYIEWEAEAQDLIDQAADLAANCDFEGAMAVLDTFSGNPDDFPALATAYQTYENGDSTLVPWDDITNIPCLSFSALIANPEVAFTGDGGSSNQSYYISTTEFTAILQQLYDNGYMLVDMYDIFTTETAGDGSTTIVKNDLRLPSGKKPIVLVQTQPDGYDYRLAVDADGKLTSEMVDGETVTAGSYDFVPLLEEFIESHPGFSFRGARAILAVTGHEGLFGYSLDETSQITQVVEALKETGYTLACNTYSNAAYGKLSLAEMEEDMTDWTTSVTPLLGETEIIVFAKSSDIVDNKEAYSGKKYTSLYESGFRYYLSVCYNSTPWMNVSEESIRQGRLLVSGNNLVNNPALFGALFDAKTVLDSNRS